MDDLTPERMLQKNELPMPDQCSGFIEVVTVKPTILVGTSTQPGTFKVTQKL